MVPTDKSKWSTNTTRIFLLLPRNKDFVAGQSRYPAIKDRAGIFLMLLLFITFAALVGSMAYQEYNSSRLASFGKVTTANIVSSSVSSGRSTTYTLQYEFQVVLPERIGNLRPVSNR